MRKVLVPIQVKLMSFFVVVLAAAISFYVFYAINLFEKDKAAYIFESVKLQNDAKASILKQVINTKNKELDLLISLSHSPNSIRSIFNQNKNLIAFARRDNNKITQSILEKLYFEEFGSDWEKLSQDIIRLNSKGSQDHLFFQYQNNYFLNIKNTNETSYIAIYKANLLINELKDSLLYRYVLIDKKSKKNILSKGNSFEVNNFLKEQNKISPTTGTFVQKIQEKRYITSYEKITKSLFLLTLVEESKAYNASYVLKKKSLYFGGFIVALTILLVMMFSKVFTNPIAKLFKASQLFANKDFSHKVELKNKDELGVLADSFNDMSSSIVKYMEEMKEKHRLQSEMQTAKLVQDSFFPNNFIKNNNFILKAFYSPATECGGDWWGKFELNGKLVIIMIDATGHGTPAALVTAMAYNALSSLKLMSENNLDLLNHPEKMMHILNQSLCDIHNDMLATGIVAILDIDSGLLTYSNASHNPMLIIRNQTNEISKDDLVPLMDAIGKRLGESKDEIYTKNSISLNHSDHLILYTDGLIEGENIEKKMWGKRNFYKQLITNSPFGIEDLVNNTVKNAYEFYAQTPQGDDITLVGVQYL